MTPADVPITAAGLPGHDVLPHGRAPQSMAFFKTAGIERLCSGVTNRSASEPSTSLLKRATADGTGCSLSWLYMGRSSIWMKLASKAALPSLTSASASLRLMLSRRFDPTMTPSLSLAMGVPISLVTNLYQG